MKLKAKKTSFALVALVAVFAVTLTASARYFRTCHESTLSLGIGRSLHAKTREYKVGDNGIRIAVPTLYTDKTHKTTKLEVEYIEDQPNVCIYIGSKIFSTTSPTVFETNWGELAQGNRWYDFSTKIDGVSYGGLYSPEVLMYSEYYPVMT